MTVSSTYPNMVSVTDTFPVSPTDTNLVSNPPPGISYCVPNDTN